MAIPSQNPTPEEIAAARKSIGLSQAAAAAVLSVHTRTWTFWESGGHKMSAASWAMFSRHVADTLAAQKNGTAPAAPAAAFRPNAGFAGAPKVRWPAWSSHSPSPDALRALRVDHGLTPEHMGRLRVFWDSADPVTADKWLEFEDGVRPLHPTFWERLIELFKLPPEERDRPYKEPPLFTVPLVPGSVAYYGTDKAPPPMNLPSQEELDANWEAQKRRGVPDIKWDDYE